MNIPTFRDCAKHVGAAEQATKDMDINALMGMHVAVSARIMAQIRRIPYENALPAAKGHTALLLDLVAEIKKHDSA